MSIIETIRAEVERRISNLSYTNDFTAKSIIEVLDDILIFLDTLQEQPVQGTTPIEPQPEEKNIRVPLSDMRIVSGLPKETILHKGVNVVQEQPVCLYDGGTPSKEKCGKCSTTCSVRVEQPVCEELEEEIKRYGKEEMPVVLESDLNDIARHFYELGRQSKPKVSEDLEEEICRYFSKHPVKFITMWTELKNTALHFAQWGESRGKVGPIHEKCSHCPLENASEELDDKATKYATEDDGWNPDGSEKTQVVEELKDAFIAGAQWQKEQMKETHCLRSEKWKEVEETARTEYENGRRDMKEQMLREAVERIVKEDAGGYPYIDATELYDYTEDKPLAKAGDKVRIVIVKGEGK